MRSEKRIIDSAVGELIKKLQTAHATVRNNGTPRRKHPAANSAYSEEATPEIDLSTIFDHWTAGELVGNVEGLLPPEDRMFCFGRLMRETFFGTITEDQLFEPDICLKLQQLGLHNCNDIMALIEGSHWQDSLDSTTRFVVTVFKETSAGPPREQGTSTFDTFWSNDSEEAIRKVQVAIADGFMIND